MRVIDGTVNIPQVKPQSDKGEQAAQPILLIVKSIGRRPYEAGVQCKGDQGILVSVTIELAATGYDGEGAG